MDFPSFPLISFTFRSAVFVGVFPVLAIYTPAIAGAPVATAPVATAPVATAIFPLPVLFIGRIPLLTVYDPRVFRIPNDNVVTNLADGNAEGGGGDDIGDEIGDEIGDSSDHDFPEDNPRIKKGGDEIPEDNSLIRRHDWKDLGYVTCLICVNDRFKFYTYLETAKHYRHIHKELRGKRAKWAYSQGIEGKAGKVGL